MLASPLPSSFLDTYNLSPSSLGCNALCMVISFLVFRFICLSSSLVYFKNSPDYLTRGDSPGIYTFDIPCGFFTRTLAVGLSLEFE